MGALWTDWKKNSLWSVIFSFCTQQQWTISGLDCDVQQKVDCTWQPAMTNSVAGLRISPKVLPKAKLIPKKHQGHCSVVVSGGLLLVWSTTALWILAKQLYLRIILSKFLRCTENCNACSQHWSTEWAQFFPTAMPDCTSHNQGFKSWTNWVTKFCLILYIHLTAHKLTNTSSSILTTFCRENASTPAGCRKCFPKISSDPKA